MKDFAELLGYTPQHLNQAFNVADVKSGLIEKVCAAMNIPIGTLYGDTPSVSNISGDGAGVNTINNDPDIINRFLSIIEEKDRQISELISKLK